jgi:hypothetical protein
MNSNSDALHLFKTLCLFSLPNFPGPTFIPCPMCILDSRVYLMKDYNGNFCEKNPALYPKLYFFLNVFLNISFMQSFQRTICTANSTKFFSYILRWVILSKNYLQPLYSRYISTELAFNSEMSISRRAWQIYSLKSMPTPSFYLFLMGMNP